MSSILNMLLDTTIFASIMIIIVLSIKVTIGKKTNLKIISIMWTLVLIRLIMPITIESPIHLEIQQPMATERANAENSQAQSDVDNVSDTWVEGNYNKATYDFEVDATTNNQEEATKTVSVFKKIINKIKSVSMINYLFYIWISGAAITFLLNLIHFVLFTIRIKKCSKLETTYLIGTLNTIKSKLRLSKKVSLIRCKYVDMPVTFGYIKPKILLPYGFENKISEEKLKLIITHELLHIKRHDILKSYLWLIAKSIHFFNPLVYVAYKTCKDDMEETIDNIIIKISTREQSFLYSQSILDVLSMSKGMKQMPLTLSFCKDKNKIRKRITNMIKPTKKLKSAGITSMLLAIIMVVGCFTTACQPTPKNIIVQNKAGEELDNAIQQTSAPTEVVPEATVEPVPVLVDTFTNDTNTITINTNATVNKLNVNVPVAKVERAEITQGIVDDIIEGFFGQQITFIKDVMTKDDIDNSIIHIKKSATDLDSDLAQSNGIDNLDDLRKQADMEIERYQKMRETAPTENPVVEKYDINGVDNIYLRGNIGKVYNPIIWYANSEVFKKIDITDFDESYNQTRTLYSNTSELVDLNHPDENFISSKELAENMIKTMGIDGVVLKEAFVSKDQTDMRSDDQAIPGVVSDKEFFVFSFERAVNDVTITTTGHSGTQSEGEYAKPTPYEKLFIWIYKGKIVQFSWQSPMKVTEIVNENVEIAIDENEALELFKQAIINKYSDMFYGRTSEIVVEVESIDLAMARVLEKDTKDFLILPVWDFKCTVKGKFIDKENVRQFPQDGEYNIIFGNRIMDPGNLLMTINALDGTTISRDLGY